MQNLKSFKPQNQKWLHGHIKRVNLASVTGVRVVSGSRREGRVLSRGVQTIYLSASAAYSGDPT